LTLIPRPDIYSSLEEEVEVSLSCLFLIQIIIQNYTLMIMEFMMIIVETERKKRETEKDTSIYVSSPQTTFLVLLL
jgi:hypothetical protein